MHVRVWNRRCDDLWGLRAEEAAFVEPVNTCLKAVRKAGIGPGQTVLVVGQGPIGSMLMQLSRWAGARTVVSDRVPDRLELANTQYLAWAFENRTALLPTAEQLGRAREVARAEKERLKGRMEILFVLPDYYSDRPKACMNGWGQRYIVVSPEGRALPCHLAHTIPNLEFESVRDRSLAEIWNDSPAFQAFRGEAWMSPTCRSCDRREIDFGGCRCQAFHLTGDASATDPVCSLSPDHDLVLTARSKAAQGQELIPLRYRGAKPSRAAAVKGS